MHHGNSALDRMPILSAMCVPMDVLEAVIVLVQVCMLEMRVPLVLLLFTADVPPGSVGDPRSEYEQREGGGERNEVPISHGKRRTDNPHERA